ncbi:MAG: gamma carbonic anhydrase family protein [Desulfobacterota bacterium]|nr:gamma carbonic anhydrase family protein [Thermodesulfobacteriota bacterium]
MAFPSPPQPLITPFEGKTPLFDESVFIDPSSRLIGEVVLKRESSIWPFALLRADSDRIVVGERSVILDKVLIEAPTGFPVLIEDEVLISHGAILHGCVVRQGAIVGIGAILLDGVEVGRDSIIGSGSVVPPHTKIPEGSLVLGIPGKVVKPLDEEARRRSREQWAEAYEKAKKYLKIFRPSGA